MAASAWADYCDARARLIHEWMDDGRSSIDCVIGLQLDVEAVERIRATSTDPPIPGCSRDQLETWQRRCRVLEQRLLLPPETGSVRPLTPLQSEVRSLLPHVDALRCGCQHWTDPPPAGTHHRDCMHGSGR
jgi:hypothetical protein